MDNQEDLGTAVAQEHPLTPVLGAHRTEAAGLAVQTWFYWSDFFTAPPPAQGTRTKVQLTQGGDKGEGTARGCGVGSVLHSKR